MQTKTFKGDFLKFKTMLEKGENFAFSRFSDGELFILQNKRLELRENDYIIGDQIGHGWYNKEEQKKFIPGEHEFFRFKLEESLKHKQKNYFKGISCKCCVGDESFKWQVDLSGGNDEDLTWSNLFINGNYEQYIKEILPIFRKKKVVMVVNEISKIQNTKFDIVNDFRVGTNCFINDYDIIKKISDYISDNKINNHLFLISAASLSNLIIKELFEKYPNNTYMDIGSSLNPILSMEGWKGSRSYLLEFWLGQPKNILNKICVW